MVGRIEISQTWATIGVNRQPGGLRITQEQAELSIKPGISSLSLRHLHDAHVQVDYRQTRSDLNLKDPVRLNRDRGAYALARSSQGIARIARDGDRMMDQPRIFPELIAQIWREPEFNLGLIPSELPEIEVTGQPWAEAEVKAESPRVDSIPRFPEINITRTAVQAYVRQRDSLGIDYVPDREIHA